MTPVHILSGRSMLTLLLAATFTFGTVNRTRAADEYKGTGGEVTALSEDGDELFAQLNKKYELKFKLKKKGLTAPKVKLRISAWVVDLSGNNLALREATEQEVEITPTRDPVVERVNGKYPRFEFEIKVKAEALVGTSVLVQVRRVGSDEESAQRGYVAIPIVKEDGTPGDFSEKEGESDPSPVRTPIGVGRRR